MGYWGVWVMRTKSEGARRKHMREKRGGVEEVRRAGGGVGSDGDGMGS